jgi:hypothetical protein
MITFGEFERIGMEGVTVYFKLLSQQVHVQWQALILMVLTLQVL